MPISHPFKNRAFQFGPATTLSLLLSLILSLILVLTACDRQLPADSNAPLASEVETLELRAPKCKGESECATVVVKREVFANRPALNQAIRQQLMHQLQGNGEDGGGSESDSLETVARDFLTEAEKVSGLSHARWQLTGEAKPLTRRGNLLTIEINSYLYSGGAHGMPVTHWLNWDLAAATEVKLTDVIKPQQATEFWALAEAEHQRWLDAQNANEEFLHNWPFQRSEDFRLSEKGLELLYGVYTLGPYSIGEVELTLPWERLGNVIRKRYLESAG